MSITTANPPPPWLVAIGRNAPPGPVPLRGSAKQVAWAETIRKTKLTTARVRAPHLVGALKVIEFSGWWIGNRNRGLDELKWPSPDEVARPMAPRSADEDGRCSVCGRPRRIGSAEGLGSQSRGIRWRDIDPTKRPRRAVNRSGPIQKERCA
jgi:hypothetical protein